jgi:hypothetical protein
LLNSSPSPPLASFPILPSVSSIGIDYRHSGFSKVSHGPQKS